MRVNQKDEIISSQFLLIFLEIKVEELYKLQNEIHTQTGFLFQTEPYQFFPRFKSNLFPTISVDPVSTNDGVTNGKVELEGIQGRDSVIMEFSGVTPSLRPRQCRTACAQL